MLAVIVATVSCFKFDKTNSTAVNSSLHPHNVGGLYTEATTITNVNAMLAIKQIQTDIIIKLLSRLSYSVAVLLSHPFLKFYCFRLFLLF